jgi:hypothetical protein
LKKLVGVGDYECLSFDLKVRYLYGTDMNAKYSTQTKAGATPATYP